MICKTKDILERIKSEKNSPIFQIPSLLGERNIKKSKNNYYI